MLLKEFSKPITVKTLNENLSKRFGKQVNVSAFTNEQLEDARNKLRTMLSQVETNESFESVNTNDTYQKNKMFLDVINAEIAERDESTDESVVHEGKYEYFDDKASAQAHAKKHGGKVYTNSGKGNTGGKNTHVVIKDSIDKEGTVVKEGAEEEATLVMAAKDMVDRITGWMEDTAEMQTESMLELGDKIRDELGIDKSDEFIGAVKPALEGLYSTLEGTRNSLTTGVAVLTGEGAPTTMGDEIPADDAEMDMEPTVDAEAEPDAPEGEDEFAAADASAGGEEEAGREKRESVDLSKRLGLLLADSKKKS
jgi:hypothetical protein